MKMHQFTVSENVVGCSVLEVAVTVCRQTVIEAGATVSLGSRYTAAESTEP